MAALRLLSVCMLVARGWGYILYEAQTIAGSNAVGRIDGGGSSAAFAALPYGSNPVLHPASGALYLLDSNTIRCLHPNGSVVTVAGGSVAGVVDGVGSGARLSGPLALAAPPSGPFVLFFLDGANAVRAFDPQLRAVTTVAGSAAEAGLVNGPALQARFAKPAGLAAAPDTLYVSEVNNHLIRRISPPVNGIVSTYAGSLPIGWRDGPLLTAAFNTPLGLALAPDGSTLYVIDKFNIRLRKIAGGFVSTLAGFGPGAVAVQDGWGTSASFYPSLTQGARGLTGLAVDGAGFVYVSESCRVRLVSPAGGVRTIAGGAACGFQDGWALLHDTPRANTTLLGFTPGGIAVAPSGGGLYLTDSNRVRYLAPPLPPTAPVCTTTSLVGGLAAGFLDGPATSALLSNPWCVATSFTGDVFFADNGNHRIRQLSPAGQVTTLVGSGSTTPTPPSTSVDGEGTSSVFNNPRGILVSSTGGMYVSEREGNRIRFISPSGSTSTICGSPTGVSGYVNGVGTSALLFAPWGLGFAPGDETTLYFAENQNNRIRAVSLLNFSVSLVAGNGLRMNAPGSLLSASFSGPFSVAFATGWAAPPASTIFYVSTSQRIAAVDLTNDLVTYIAGGLGGTFPGTDPQPAAHVDGVGALAGLMSPRTLVWSPTRGLLIVGEYAGPTLSTVTPAGVVRAIVGGGTSRPTVDGVGTSAVLWSPTSVVVDSDGDIFFADAGNNGIRSLTCRACRLGAFCPTNISLFSCPGGSLGMASSVAARTSCTAQCPAGKFCPAGSTTSTMQVCPIGSYCPQGAAAPTLCAPGTFAPVAESSFCPSCPPGSLTAVNGSGICSSYCPPGTYRSNPGGVDALSSCFLCPAGTYGPFDGAISCVPCPVNSFSPTLGAVNASVCRACPPRTSSPAASTSAAACASVPYACPPLQQPSLGVASTWSGGAPAPTSAAQCSPLVCLPPLALVPATEASTVVACRGCPAGAAGSYPNCTSCTDPAQLCVGGQGVPLLPLVESSLAGRAVAGGGGASGAASSSSSSSGISPSLWGVGAGAGVTGLLLLYLTFCVRRLGIREKIDNFALKPPDKSGGHPTMLPTDIGALCTIFGYTVILALALLQVVNFFSPQNTLRTDSSGLFTRDSFASAQAFPWRGAGGVTLSLSVGASSSEGSSGNASACARALGWSASPLEEGTWVEAAGPSMQASSLIARAPVSLQYDCLGCVFSPASSLHFFLHHSCQALYIFATATAADGLVSFQSLSPRDTCGSTRLGSLASITWQLSPMLHTMNDTLPFTQSTSAKGYQLMSQQAKVVTAPRGAPTADGSAVDFAPLQSAISVTVELPLSTLLQASTLAQALTWVQLLTGISGLMGLLGVFGILASVGSKFAVVGKKGEGVKKIREREKRPLAVARSAL